MGLKMIMVRLGRNSGLVKPSLVLMRAEVMAAALWNLWFKMYAFPKTL